MSKINLDSYADRKSFYGKAYAMRDGNGNIYLVSYGTVVAGMVNGKSVRYWGGWPATTGRHLAAFLRMCGFDGANKSAWDKLEVSRLDWSTKYNVLAA